VDEASLSLKRLHRGGLGGGAPSLGTLEDMLEGSNDGTSLCEGPGGRAPLLGNSKDGVFERYAKCPVSGPPSL